MCGIIGFSGKSPANPDKLALLMYMNSQTRGSDNTGIYTKETGIVKTSSKAEDFLQKNQIPECNLFIGHVRRASVGNKDQKNAHPFEYDNLVGVHNGTLENHLKMLLESDNDYKATDYDVDSQILYRLLADDNKIEGEEKNFTTLTKFIGAAALVFTDTELPNRLYTYRTLDRPLYYGMIDEGMYMSSLEEGLKMIGCKDIKQFTFNNLNIVVDGKIESTKHYDQAKKPVTVYNGGRQANAYNTPAYKQPLRDVDYYAGMGYDEYDSEKYKSYQPANNKAVVNARVSSIKNLSDINNAELVGRWITAFADYQDKPYGKVNISLTKDVWYFVSDHDSSNNLDVTINDDTQKLVSVNKFLFASSSLEFKGFAVAMSDIVDTKGKMLWKEDDIIEIIDGNIKGKSIEVQHEQEGRTYNINVKFLRQATVKEMQDYDMSVLDKEIAEHEEEKGTTGIEHHGVRDMYDRARDIRELSKKYDKPEIETVVPEVDTYSAEVAESPFKDQDTEMFGVDADTPKDVEIINEYEELDDEDKVVNLSTYMHVIDKLDDEVSELGELIASTNFEELKEGYKLLKALIEQSRDVEFVEDNM